MTVESSDDPLQVCLVCLTPFTLHIGSLHTDIFITGLLPVKGTSITFKIKCLSSDLSYFFILIKHFLFYPLF